MDASPRWPLASWQLRVTSALSHPDSASAWNAGLWPSPLKRTGHLKASSTHDSWDSLHGWGMGQGLVFHTALQLSSLPGKEGRNCQSQEWGSLSESKQRTWEVAEERFSLLLSLAWADACFETRRQTHNKKSASLPPRSIYFPLTNSDFIFLPVQNFFSFSFKLSPGQRGKRLFAHVLICQTRHCHALTTILGTSPCLPRLQPKGNFPTQLSPSPNTLF